MLQYSLFFRQFGIRRVSQLMGPPLPVLDRLNLPKNSLFHYAGEGLLDDGPKSDEFIFRNITRPILVANITHIGDNKGTPRRLGIPVDPLIRSYHIKNRRYRKLAGLDTIPKDPMSMVVVNYSFIPRLYRYMRSIYSEYFRWNNQQAAIWKAANEVADNSERNQFIVFKLPKRLPSISELRLATKQMNQRAIKTFSDPDSLMILEIWKWLGDSRSSSLLNFVKRENYSKINLIFMESGRFFVLNLGILDSWRASTKEELITLENPNTKGFPFDQLQKRFLRLLVSLFDVRTNTQIEENLGDDEPSKTEEETEESTNKDTLTLDENNERQKAIDLDYEPASDIEENFGEDIDIDKELAELERIAQLSNTDINVTNSEDESEDDDDTYSQPDPEQELVTELSDTISSDSKLLEDALQKYCDRMAENGLLSANEYRRYSELGKTYKTIIAPDGTTTLDKFIAIDKEELKVPEDINVPDKATVYDKTMLKSSLLVFDEYYIKNIMQKDIAAMVMNIQKAGIAVTDYRVNTVETILGSYNEYTIRINPVDGSPSTIRFKLPVVDDNGVFTANGSKYYLRKQKNLLPLFKVSPSRVALTSYYGKTFVDRSKKKVNDYGQWIRDQVSAINLSNDDHSVEELYHSIEFDNTFMCPRIYSILSMEFKSFKLRPKAYPRIVGQTTYEINLNHKKRLELYGADAIKDFEIDGSIIIGQNDTGGLLVVDKNDAFYHVQTSSHDKSQVGNLIAMGTIETLLELDESKAPVEYAELKVLGRTIPIGVILGYELGLEKLIKLLKVEPRRVPVGTRVNLIPQEYALVFNDETLVFSKDDAFSSMILAGFNEYHRTLREYNVHEFSQKAVYLNLIESVGMSHRYLREIDNLYQLFVDPITRDLLIEMKEPTSFRGLLLRSCELLQYDQHPDELDGRYMRVRGYERFAGAVYTEITKSIRAHSGRANKSNQQIDLNPYQVWMAVTTDTAKVQISEINPIEDLKNQEALTFAGSGGRTSRTMTKHTRGYHPNDRGIVSEATVDSSDTGYNTYLSANPLFTSVRGISKPYSRNRDGLTSLVSTSALLSPSVTKDDMRRANFVSTQNKHVVDCDGYTQSLIRTGYEQIVPHRTSDLFAYTARMNGKVISVSKDGIIIEYENGERKGFQLGRRYGEAAGLTIPHTVKTDLKAGDDFKEGDVICYNPGFFEKDYLDPNQVILKYSLLATTVLMENPITLEDSSAISKELAQRLTAGVTKTRTIVLNFYQNIHRLVEVGQEVDVEDILCIIEDPVGSSTNLLDDEALDTLRTLSAQTPISKTKGVVERIEVYYHGEKEDMTESLRQLADESDKAFLKRNKASNQPLFNGSVDDSFRVDGNPLMLDTLAIKIYISHRSPVIQGDKGVFANQLKTVFGEVMEEEVRTESGKVIDAIFGKLSVDNRIVGSVDEMGTTNVLLELLAQKAVKAYES